MSELNVIQNFIGNKKVALIGVSRSNAKFGNAILKDLTKRGYQVFPIHSEISNIDGIVCYNSLSGIPDGVENLIISAKPDKAEKIIPEAAKSKIKRIWLQQGSSSENVIRLCKENNIDFVQKRCILMFAEPVDSIHKFHRFIWKIFGQLPK